MPVKLRLNDILSERGISQRKLALDIEVRPATINHLCKGDVTAIQLETIDKICEYLDIEPADLIVNVSQ